LTNLEKRKVTCALFNDNFQNFKHHGNIPKAQLVIVDIPFNIGNNFYGSNPMWYKGGDNHNGESKFAKKAAFNTDFNFNTVIDPVAGSGSALRAAAELGRNAYGFEIDKTFFNGAKEKMLVFQDDSVKVITEQPDVINISSIQHKAKA